MRKKTNFLLLSSVLVFSLVVSPAMAATNTNPEITEPVVNESESKPTEKVNQNYVKVMFEEKIIFHEQVPTKTYIQVLNSNDEVLQSEVLSSDTELELAAPDLEKGEMFSYWSIEKGEDNLTIKPVIVAEKELSVKFTTTEGGHLLENNAQTTEVVKSVNKGSVLKDALPEVNPEENHKFLGWFEKVSGGKEEKISDIEKRKIVDAKGNYFAKFFPDYDDNDIDDRTEEITVKFVTNSSDKFKDIKTNVGNQIELLVLEKDDSIFMGWYTDEEFKNKYTDDVLTGSLTLYGKWEKAEKVIEDAQTKPITDKDISNQVEKILNERLKEFENGNSTNQTPSKNSTTEAPKSSATSKSNEEPKSSATPKNNEAPKASENPPVTNDSASQSFENGYETIQSMPDINNSEVIVQPSEPVYEGNTSNNFKETKYVFANKNIGQVHMVKFFDQEDRFLFSLTLPYGKTIKLYDENEEFRAEYAIRQDTTITINTDEYVNEGSTLIEFETREVGKNATRITEIFPNVNVNSTDESIAYEKAMASAAMEKQADTKRNLWFILIGGLLALAAGITYYFLKKRRESSEEEEVEPESV